jgi:hypothetical protein
VAGVPRAASLRLYWSAPSRIERVLTVTSTPLWQYAVYALVIYSRAAAERLAVPVAEIARRIAARHGLELLP